MEAVTKIAIFGVGLIGGSLALCYKGNPKFEVVGHSYRQSSVEKYVARGVCDSATTSMEEAADGADFIFLCVPVGLLGDYLRRLHALPLKPGCIITDVGSTKASLAREAAKLSWDHVHFIGGHPMAGKEQSGVEAASAHLFENAFYVLAPLHGTPDSVVGRMEQLLTWTKAHVIKVDAEQHDIIVGAISHLPHVIAAALVNQIAAYNEENSLYAQLAAGGFRDITRIASSDAVIWRDILINNRDIMIKLLHDWNTYIARFVDLLEQRDAQGIEQEFQRASDFRNELPERRRGILHPLYDIYVDVPDTPGVIGHITSQLGEQKINLSNIQIMEHRLDIPGVLRLSFREETHMARAAELLKQLGYSIQM